MNKAVGNVYIMNIFFELIQKLTGQLLTLPHLMKSRVKSFNTHVMIPKIQNIFALKP